MIDQHKIVHRDHQLSAELLAADFKFHVTFGLGSRRWSVQEETVLRTSQGMKAGEQCAMETSLSGFDSFPEDNTCLRCVVLSLVQNELYCGADFWGSALCCSERNSYATFTKQVLIVNLFIFLNCL